MLGAVKGDFQPVFMMDVGGGRGDSPFNLFHVGILNGDHHCEGLLDNWNIDAESEASWRPYLKKAVELFPFLNDVEERLTADDHRGSRAAFCKEVPNAVSFSCAVHRRRHFWSDARYGTVEVRRLLTSWYDSVVRTRNYQDALVQIAALKNDNLTKNAWALLRKTPIEQIIPAMRHQPTKRTVKPGPMFNEVTSNEAEATMHMMLPVRRLRSLAEHIVAYWETRRRRWRVSVNALRSAQQKDTNMPERKRGLTPFVLSKVNQAEERAQDKCPVVGPVVNLTCQVQSASSAVLHKVTLTQPCSPESMCSNGCMENCVGVCPHVASAVLKMPGVNYRDILPRWQTLEGFAKQLGVKLDGDPKQDDEAFMLPTQSDVLSRIREDSSLDHEAVVADKSSRRQCGRIKGSVEENIKKKQKLRQEVADGKKTGVDTVSDAVLPVFAQAQTSKPICPGPWPRLGRCGVCVRLVIVTENRYE